MFDYVDYQEQRKKREGFGLHTVFIPTTSRRRRKFRRTEKTDFGLCQILQGQTYPPAPGNRTKSWISKVLFAEKVDRVLPYLMTYELEIDKGQRQSSIS